MKKLSIVVPVYNEENGIKPFLDRTEAVMEKLECDYEIIFSLDLLSLISYLHFP